MASYTWKGVSGDWNLASNWTPAGGPPKSKDSAKIKGSATTTVTVDTADVAKSLTLSDANATLNDDGPSASLTIGGTLSMSNGTLNLSPDGDGGVLTVGALNLSGGALTLYSGGQLNLNGTLSQTGGTLTLEGGTISDGTINSTAGTLAFTDEGGVLSGVTFDGPLNLTSTSVSEKRRARQRNDGRRLLRLGAWHDQRHGLLLLSLFRQHADRHQRHDQSRQYERLLGSAVRVRHGRRRQPGTDARLQRHRRRAGKRDLQRQRRLRRRDRQRRRNRRHRERGLSEHRSAHVHE